MSRSEVTEEQIREVARRIGEQPGVVQVWLFGSHATGAAGPDSDVDLLAVYEHEPESRLGAMIALGDLVRPRPFPLDILVTGAESFRKRRRIVGTLANMVAHDGRVVHERV